MREFIDTVAPGGIILFGFAAIIATNIAASNRLDERRQAEEVRIAAAQDSLKFGGGEQARIVVRPDGKLLCYQTGTMSAPHCE